MHISLEASEAPSASYIAKLHAQVNVIRARLSSRPGVDPGLRDCWTLVMLGSSDDAWNDAVCGTPGCTALDSPGLQCRGCHVQGYCSRSCQRADWEFHKQHCTSSFDDPSQ
ncbi:hypothetical protein DL93DRAFT_2092293 [Clavulina sp. PMI_390]|nr:hypothetical protein DL93DRAFT_2092293 [Clavulina sp. PMI_390]